MDIFLYILAIVLCLIGLAGCILPGLPGPPFNFGAMLILQWMYSPFESYLIIVFAILTAAILVIDYLLPIWFAKKFGATKQGIWGSIIGMILGIFFTPIGMILGLLLGAVLGDLLAGRTSSQATKSGFATVFGTLLSTGLKLGIAGMITVFVFYEIIIRSFF